MVVAPGQTAHEAEEENHHKYQEMLNFREHHDEGHDDEGHWKRKIIFDLDNKEKIYGNWRKKKLGNGNRYRQM